MFALRVSLACFSLVLAASLQGGESGKPTIVGLWEVVKSSDAPAGSSVEFTKDGKLILIPKGKEDTPLKATYKIVEKKLMTVRTEKGKDEINILTIQSLDHDRLTTLNERGEIDELKRRK